MHWSGPQILDKSRNIVSIDILCSKWMTGCLGEYYLVKSGEFCRNLNSNLLTTLPSNTFQFLPALQQLRLDLNNFACRWIIIHLFICICTQRQRVIKSCPNGLLQFSYSIFLSLFTMICFSCNILWLAKYLRKNPQLGVGTICQQPAEWVS